MRRPPLLLFYATSLLESLEGLPCALEEYVGEDPGVLQRRSSLNLKGLVGAPPPFAKQEVCIVPQSTSVFFPWKTTTVALHSNTPLPTGGYTSLVPPPSV